MRIAIIGSGISGMVAAYLLHQKHEITVFEANNYIGGHTHTHQVRDEGSIHAIDTGFIVFNEQTYPNFCRLLDRLGVESQPSNMSFSVACERSGLEYNGSSLNQLFVQRRNLLRPGFYRMLSEILRFNREMKIIHDESSDQPLEDYVTAGGYSRRFVDHYLVPMGAAIWSADASRFGEFPIRTFARFMHNHGMLSWYDRPQWRVIRGGSHRYVQKLTAPYADRIRLCTPIELIRRHSDFVEIRPKSSDPEQFDQVIIAVHSDQALRMLADATETERSILGAIPYQPNQTVLHTDERVLPVRRRAWASWNYRVPRESTPGVTMTYNANLLQNLRSSKTFCTSLNLNGRVGSDRIIREMTYHHPIYSLNGVRAQRRHREISGVNRTHFCGAYWGYGFHEDGVNSALAVCKHFGSSLS